MIDRIALNLQELVLSLLIIGVGGFVMAHDYAPDKGLEWHTLRLPAYTEAYKASSEPVLSFAHGKPSEEREYRVCAVAEGDGEVLLVFAGNGDGVEFHYKAPTDVCAVTYLGEGGNGEHLNKLDLYLFQRGKQAAILYRPEISVGVMR